MHYNRVCIIHFSGKRIGCRTIAPYSFNSTMVAMGAIKKQSKKRKRGLETLPRVVTIGGGTGSFTLLTGLKEYELHISAIVNMADDGGSTGILRDELGVLPPGDVRQCLAALANAAPEVRELFSYRFPNGEMKGHNVGNLFLSALEKVTGSFSRAVAVAGKILNVHGRIIPVTEEDMRLVIELNNGVALYGESKLDDNEDVRDVGVRDISLVTKVYANPLAITAIEKANVIIMGPGDLYGSIVPNLLVDGIAEALKKTKAKVIVVANLTNKKGLTDGFVANDYVVAIERHLLGRKVDVLVHNSGVPNTALEKKYEAQEGAGMFVVHQDCKRGYTVLSNDFLNGASSLEDSASHTHTNARLFIRHNSKILADTIVEYIHAL